MGLSVNVFTYTGSDEFDLNFAMGYASQSDITCIQSGNPPTEYEFDWIGPSRVRLASGHGLQVGEEIKFYRTVSKTSLPVDLDAPGALTRETVEEVALHNAYMMHEILDGRIDDVTAVDQAIIDTINDSVDNAIQATTLLISQRYPVNVSGELDGVLNGVVPVDMQSNISEVTVVVANPPSVDVELLFENDSTLKFWVNVTAAGVATVTTSTVDGDFTLSTGAITATETSGNYVSGLEILVGINGVDLDYLSFTADHPDYLTIYMEAKE